MEGARRMARASRAHPASSWHWSRIALGLLCAQEALATSGILRMVNARPGACTRLGDRCDLIEINSPGWPPRAICALDADCVTGSSHGQSQCHTAACSGGRFET